MILDIIPLQVQHGILMRHDDKIFITPVKTKKKTTTKKQILIFFKKNNS